MPAAAATEAESFNPKLFGEMRSFREEKLRKVGRFRTVGGLGLPDAIFALFFPLFFLFFSFFFFFFF